MSMKIIRGNRAELLADAMIREVAEELQKKDLFQTTEILVPNKGIAKFLKLRFTEQCGAFATVEFPFLMNWLVRKVFRLSGSFALNGQEASDSSDFQSDIRPETIAWRIYAMLPKLMKRNEYKQLERWCTDDDPLRIYQLSKTFAALFDRYMLLRPDWLNCWERGEMPEELSKHPSEEIRQTASVQADLWMKIVGNTWKEKHYAAKTEEILNGGWVPEFPFPVRLFGFSSIADSALSVMERIAEKSEVHLYSFEPCRDYWGEAKGRKEELTELERIWFSQENGGNEMPVDLSTLFFTNNSFLGSFGRAGRAFFVRTSEYGEGPDCFHASKRNSILADAQNRILENSPSGNDGMPEPEVRGRDRTAIQIHSCYSAYREVETVHDYLLQCFAKDKTLRPRDVLILSPDCGRYGPIVEAVFHNPGIPEGKRLEVSMSDQNLTETQSEFITLLRILKVHKTEFGASDLFSILGDSSVMKHFHFDAESFPRCREFVAAAGIRWGWNEDDRQAASGISFAETSWRTGLDRMLLRYATDSDTAFRAPDGHEIPPAQYMDVESLGNLLEFAVQLHKCVLLMRGRETKGVPLDEWRHDVIEIANTFFGDRAELSMPLKDALSNLMRNAEFLSEDTLIPSDVLLAALQDVLTEPSAQQGFLTGRVTFCGMRPMRSIPARIICLLGMNYDSFPSQNPRYGFDLIPSFPRTNDHTTRDDERQLFMELLLSARDSFYISYVGRGIRDNKSRPPSACVEELRQWLIRTFGGNSFVFAENPLQSFSPQCFVPGSPIQSHSKDLCKAAQRIYSDAARNEKQLLNVPGGLPGEVPGELLHITLNDLVYFFRNPAEQFVRKRLKASPYGKRHKIPDDTEPFEIREDTAVQYLYNKLMDGVANADDFLRNAECCLKSDALLPTLPYGKVILQNIFIEVQPFFESTIRDTTPEQVPGMILHIPVEKDIMLHLEVPDCTLRVASDGVRRQIMPIFGKKYCSHMIEGKVRHSVMSALFADGVLETRIVTKDESDTVCRQTYSESSLSSLCKIYYEGMKRPVPFFPNTSYAYGKCSANPSKKSPRDEALKQWKSTDFSTGDDVTYARYFGMDFPYSPEFESYANTVFQSAPFYSETSKNKKKTKEME